MDDTHLCRSAQHDSFLSDLVWPGGGMRVVKRELDTQLIRRRPRGGVKNTSTAPHIHTFGSHLPLSRIYLGLTSKAAETLTSSYLSTFHHPHTHHSSRCLSWTSLSQHVGLNTSFFESKQFAYHILVNLELVTRWFT
jgi:hypothetical protein